VTARLSIGIVGAGKVGRALAGRLVATGHEVVLGARDVSTAQAVEGAGLAPIDAALDTAENVIVALPGAAVPGFIAEHATTLDGKVVLDASNDAAAMADGHPAHHLAAWAASVPGAAVFRAFNTVGWEVMADPEFGGVQADLLYCGPEGPERERAEAIIAAVGFRPVSIGDADNVDLLDGVFRLWMTLALAQGRGRHLALKVLEDDAAG
jgi:8-hydroxy-5-deazaflavin:NADPH oxidoreductase